MYDKLPLLDDKGLICRRIHLQIFETFHRYLRLKSETENFKITTA